jgi:hypothetical protein
MAIYVTYLLGVGRGKRVSFARIGCVLQFMLCGPPTMVFENIAELSEGENSDDNSTLRNFCATEISEINRSGEFQELQLLIGLGR